MVASVPGLENAEFARLGGLHRVGVGFFAFGFHPLERRQAVLDPDRGRT